jgi:nicotinamidase-related amidase
MPNPKEGKLELLTDRNSALVLVDYQPTMVAGVGSGDKTIIRNAAYCAAKAAGILNVHVVLSTINPQHNGNFIADVTKLFPGQEVYARVVPSFDAFEDEKTYTAFKKTSRKKMVISGLWTSMCFVLCRPALNQRRLRDIWADGQQVIPLPMLTSMALSGCCKWG